ncbi:OprD family outer membrane porin [Nitrosophilus kaiyonis]|uniref:OprD family outer membrane porin n=1 Tax=Nitrosophilus kaiyonis TaxID=2930200 RepID=UPI00248F6B70|nr:OprD family outer membrane porin [Nitrosophilus kaiyonis]
MKKGLLLSAVLANMIFANESFLDYYLEIRGGYIYIDQKQDIDKKAFGIGGNIHFDTKDFYGFKAGVSLYTLQDFGLNPKKEEIAEEFYGEKRDGFSFVNEAYLSYQYKDTQIKAGRFLFDSPHADSDDIMMTPNFFEGYLIKNSSFDNIILTLAHLNKMAGWENGADIKKFVNLNETLGIEEKTDGLSIAALEYEKDNLAFSIWGYKLYDIANIFYIESSYGFSINDLEINFALQFDRAKDSGESLMNDIDTKTFGAMIENSYKNFTLSLAYNKEFGDTGSMFSFGGGPFFTSMEDQTIDGVEDKDAKSYNIGFDYGFDEYNFGLIYGKFEVDDKESYETKEIDAYIEAKLLYDIEAQIVYANINDMTQSNEDKDIFKVILKRSF